MDEFTDPDPGLQDWEQKYIDDGWPGCPHFLNRIGSVKCNIGCASEKTRDVSVFSCGKRGICTLGRRRKDIQDCLGCEDRPQ